MTNTAYIYDAVRSPYSRGKPTGTLYEVKPIALAAGLLNGLSHRHNLDTSRVDDVVLGCVTPVGDQGSNIAKAAVQFADWDDAIPGFQLDRFCTSGLEAIATAAAKIGVGWQQCVVAGGLECMSRAPAGSNGGPFLTDPALILGKRKIPQGIAADLIATLEGFSREAVDAYALQSQHRAATAQTSGFFDRSIIPVLDPNGSVILGQDDIIDPSSNLEKLSQLKPSFDQVGAMGYDDFALSAYPELERVRHIHTNGNSASSADGASAVLLGNAHIGRELGLEPRARITAYTAIAQKPMTVLKSGTLATQQCLTSASLTAQDIDLWEIGETFAAVALQYIKKLNLDPALTNVNGGAIAIGHPIGATGGCLISTLLDELERKQKKRGLAAINASGGISAAMIIERL